MMKSIKRMILTGAAVMVMMSLTSPAMAYDRTSPYSSHQDASYQAGLEYQDEGNCRWVAAEDRTLVWLCDK
jgi:hypothetical protein